MNKEDIRSLTRIGQSLWGDLEQSVAISEDTLTSISLLNLSDLQTIERASKVMIELAERNPPTLLKLNHPFYRMAPIERFLLTASHLEKWSYERISRTLGVEKTLLEPWIWAIRLKFCFQESQSDLEYPNGPGSLGPTCPDYSPSSPWTQRMMDDELGKQERFYLQGHLMGCEKCRGALERTRKMIFKIESMIPGRDLIQEIDLASDRILESWKIGESTLRPIKVDTRRSIVEYLSETRNQFILTALLLLIFYWATRHTFS